MKTFAAAVESRLAAAERRPAPWLLALAAVVVLQVSPWWVPTPDSVVYLSIARSVAAGEGLRNLGSPHLGLPPGYPLLLSPAFLVGDEPFLAISCLQVALGVLVVLGVHRWANRRVPGAALLLAALVAVDVSFWIHLRRSLAEIAFMAALVWAAEAMESVLAARSRRSAARASVTALVLLVAATLIREPAALLVLGFALAALRHPPEVRRRALVAGGIAAFAAAGVVAVLLVWSAATAAADFGPIGTHLDGFLDPTRPLLPRILEGARLRVSEIGRLLVPGMFKAYGDRWLDWNGVVYVPLACLVGVGWWRLVRRAPDVLALTFPAYLALHVVWGFDAGTRYLLPMLPILFAALWLAAEGLRERRAVWAAAALALHFAVAVTYVITREIPRARLCDAEWPAARALAASAGEPPRIAPPASECRRLYLSFLLDRPIPEPSTPSAAASRGQVTSSE